MKNEQLIIHYSLLIINLYHESIIIERNTGG